MSDTFKTQFGQVHVIEVYRCTCGKLVGKAETVPERWAAKVHESPACSAFENASQIPSALVYFATLERLPLSVELVQSMARNIRAS